MKLGQSKAERFHQKPVLDQNQVCYNRDVTRKCRNQHPIQICASKDRNFTIACCKQNSIKSVPPKTEKFHHNMLQTEFYPNLRFQSHSEHVEEPFNSTKGSTHKGKEAPELFIPHSCCSIPTQQINFCLPTSCCHRGSNGCSRSPCGWWNGIFHSEGGSGSTREANPFSSARTWW